MEVAEKSSRIDDLIRQLLDVEAAARRIAAEQPKAYELLIQAQQEELSAAIKLDALDSLTPGPAAAEASARYNDLLSKGEACRRMCAGLRTKIQSALEAERKDLLVRLDDEREAIQEEEKELRKEFSVAMARVAFVAVKIWGKEGRVRKEQAFHVERDGLEFYEKELDRLKAEAGIESFPATPSERLQWNKVARLKAEKPVGNGEVEERIQAWRTATSGNAINLEEGRHNATLE